MIADPRVTISVLGGSLVAGVVTYVVVDQILTTMNISGGLWDVGKLLLSILPVAFATRYVFM